MVTKLEIQKHLKYLKNGASKKFIELFNNFDEEDLCDRKNFTGHITASGTSSTFPLVNSCYYITRPLINGIFPVATWTSTMILSSKLHYGKWKKKPDWQPNNWFLSTSLKIKPIALRSIPTRFHVTRRKTKISTIITIFVSCSRIPGINVYT